MLLSILRWFSITIGALVITTLALNAFDNIEQPGNSMLGSAIGALSGSDELCPGGMVFVDTSGGGFCIDAYEAAASEACPRTDPQGRSDTTENLNAERCEPVSQEGMTPWRHVTQAQAQQACARAGKRLPSSDEWYRAALGTPNPTEAWGAQDCNVDAVGVRDPDPTGARGNCVSPAGAHDMVGNVWEWVDGTVRDGVYEGQQLPPQGYVAGVDSNGMPILTSEESDPAYSNDYFWINEEGSRGIIRGGYWGNRTDAGLYAMNAMMESSFAGNAVGFRCAMGARR